jgi:2-polyprenyl-6-hydroxyphenyl methylase/3-demethylubiquinone-9 3-methyltransferase
LREAGERFAFGKNWQSFVDSALNTQRISKASDSLRRLLNAEHLCGRTFIDIGCGSGLFSLAACLLGAQHVVAFDYDQDSVEASIAVRARAGISPDRWHIQQGSVLDRAFLDRFDPADIVYSWGVLHHTGAMWQAIDNAVSKVKPGGQLAIAIYNDVDRTIGGSAMWWRIKRTYNMSPEFIKRAMEVGYITTFLLKDSANLRNPLRAVRNYSSDSGRGMDFWHDARDWLGGFPYEYATAAAAFNYLYQRFGLQLEYLNTSSSVGCNEFTFRKPVVT